MSIVLTAAITLFAIVSDAQWANIRETHTRATSPAPVPTDTSGAVPTVQALPPASTATGSPTTRTTGLPAGLTRTTGTRGVALTFDDGPHPVWTPKVLDQLRKARVKATFCLIGTEAQRYPKLVARIVREGHTLCNHSWHHEFDLGKLPEEQIRTNLERTNRAIRRAVPGAQIGYFRQPGGRWTTRGVKVARDLGMVPLHWSVDPADWRRPGTRVLVNRITDHARAGSIILLHDGGGDRSATLSACPTVLATLQRKYGIVALG